MLFLQIMEIELIFIIIMRLLFCYLIILSSLLGLLDDQSLPRSEEELLDLKMKVCETSLS